MGHAPVQETALRHACPTRWTVASEQEASLHKANPSMCEMTSLVACQRRSLKGHQDIFESIHNQTDLVKTWKTAFFQALWIPDL